MRGQPARVMNTIGKPRETRAAIFRRLSPGFAVHIAIVFLALGLVQLAGSLVFYQIIDRQTLRDDHARRVAELLIVGERMHEIAPAQTAKNMTTRYLFADVSPTPNVAAPSDDEMLADIAARIVAWEPSLSGRPLHLSLLAQQGEGRNLAGSLQLADGSWFNFQSRDITSMWPVAWRAMVLTMLLTAAFMGIGLVVLHRIGKPLRRLTDVAETIGQGKQIAISETGPKDLRDLAHAMNVMQERIARLLSDQAAAFEAITHDLRTPLSRQLVATSLVDDDELSQLLKESIAEITELLDSLQAYLNAQHFTCEPETIALAEFLRSEMSGFGGAVTISPSDDPEVRTFREPLALALRALIENALQYAGEAVVRLNRRDGDWVIDISDNGPGLAQEYYQPVLEPFFRLDEARQRNTKGFGLGIPMVHRLMMRFNGGLSFSSPAEGGLPVHLTVPTAA